MYNVINPAKAKSIMLRMNGLQLETEIAFFELELKTLEPGNTKQMYLKLRAFAKNRLRKLYAHPDRFEFES